MTTRWGRSGEVNAASTATIGDTLLSPALARFAKGALRVLTKGNVGSHAIGGGPRRAKQPAFV